MGLALCVTNVIGFTKSSKGAQHAARARCCAGAVR
jgi:hypothetical protein